MSSPNTWQTHIAQLQELQDAPISESIAQRLFAVYLQNNPAAAANGEVKLDDATSWSAEHIRMFLMDLDLAINSSDAAFHVVSDAAVKAAVGELQLDSTQPGCVTFVEFKSFFVYLMQAPLKHLHSVAMGAQSKVSVVKVGSIQSSFAYWSLFFRN